MRTPFSLTSSNLFLAILHELFYNIIKAQALRGGIDAPQKCEGQNGYRICRGMAIFLHGQGGPWESLPLSRHACSFPLSGRWQIVIVC